MTTSHAEDRRARAAVAAFNLIETEVRPHLAAGGNLGTKGSGGYPHGLRQVLRALDEGHPATFVARAAMELAPTERVVEHVIPFKRIIVEIVDPSQADPRSNTLQEPIAGGPATSPEHLLPIFDKLVQKCWVTKDEHDRLNRAGRSFQWDAPDGDGWARYRLAGVVAYPLA